MDNNADRQTLSEEHMKRTSALSKHLKHIEREKSLQVMLLSICGLKSQGLSVCVCDWGWRGGVMLLLVFVEMHACCVCVCVCVCVIGDGEEG